MVLMMSETTKNAPFGTDDTPHMRVKIIGGKRVQVAVDDCKEIRTARPDYRQNWLSPLPGPHGTPSILNQPDWEAYDSGLQSGYSTSNQHRVARKVSSYTSPAGDRSYSFKHGLPMLNTKTVLPPIATQPVGGVYAYHDHYLSNENFLASTLEKEVGKQLQGFSPRKLKDMYVDLTTFDRKLTGMVGESQFSLVSLRHDLPLKLSLLKIIFAKYIDTRDPTMINYEKILQFLSDCVADAGQNVDTKKLDRVPENRTQKIASVPLQNHIGSAVILENSLPLNDINRASKPSQPSAEQHTSPLRREEEDKLVGLIMAQLSPAESLDVTDLKLSLQELDRLQSGSLPIHVISSACIRHRIPLTDSIISKMLHRAETAGGMADWKCFVEPLERVQELRTGHTTVSDLSERTTSNSKPLPDRQAKSTSESFTGNQQRAPASAALPWERKPLSAIRANGKQPAASEKAYSPVSTASTEGSHRVQLPEGWDEHELLDRTDAHNQPKNSEPWVHKFNKLGHALHTYNPLNKETLPRDEAQRVTKNYNLIYGLGFSEKKIENAVQQSLLPKKDGSPGHRVSVDALLELLEGKRRTIV